MTGSSERDPRHARALVLGGGGVTGIAWMTGIAVGLDDRGVDLLRADRIIGTSAGAAVAAQITGADIDELFQRQVEPERQVAELTPDIHRLKLAASFVPALVALRNRRKFRERVGRIALRSESVPPERRLEVIAARLPSHEWPDANLEIVAIDAESGEERIFDGASGVALRDAVAASCAVPGVWPVVRIDGSSYYDGGIPSPENAHRAVGHARVLVLAPMGLKRSGEPRTGLRKDVEALESDGARVLVLGPDEGARAAMGRNVLDPAARGAAAEAGRRQGSEEAARVREVWE